MLGAISALAPLSNDSALPAFPQIARALDAPDWMMQASLGGFMLAFALGQLIYGPLSDRWGRRPVIVLGMVLYTVAGIACAFAPNAMFLDAARFFQGLGACAGATVTRAIVRDVVSDRREAARLQAYITVAVSIAPVVAPLLGAAIMPLGWRAIYGFLAISGLVLVAVATFSVPETLRPQPQAHVLESYRQFLRLPRSLPLAFVIATVFGAYFSYISGSPFVLEHQLHLPPLVFSIAFATNALCLLAGSYTGGHLARTMEPDRILQLGTAGVGVAGIATLLVGFHPTLIAFVALMSAFAFCYGMSIPQAYALGLHEAPQIAGTASATLGSSQQLGGSIGSTVVGMLPFTSSINVGICAALGGLLSIAFYRRSVPKHTLE